MKRGDEFKMPICNNSGTIAIYDKDKSQYFSSLIDGPIHSEIKGKEITNVKKISKYAKDFSIVEVPYCFKLLMQELSSMNVQMRLITEESVNKKIIPQTNESQNVLNVVYDENNPEEQEFEEEEEATEAEVQEGGKVRIAGSNIIKHILTNDIKAWNYLKILIMKILFIIQLY